MTTCTRPTCQKPVASKRVWSDDEADFIQVPNLTCSQRCAVKRWREQYQRDNGVSYDVMRGRSLRAARQESTP